MRHALLPFLLVPLFAAAQPLPAELQLPAVVAENRRPMHAAAFGYESDDLAEGRDPGRSAYFRSLNGPWKFHWVQDPRQRPLDFFRPEFDDSAWTTFPVPANWELNGYGLPIYVNHPYEFTGHAKRGARLDPPLDIPVDNNPVGSYRRTFTLPADWADRQVFIHLGAVKSAFFIWINGRRVGYSEDSKLAAEFDITPYVQPGENLVALQVYRWSDGSYLECQDMWRISGIERDVYLYATPKLHVADTHVRSTLANAYRDGRLELAVQIENYQPVSGLHAPVDTFRLAWRLADAAGRTVAADSTRGAPTVIRGYRQTVRFAQTIPGVAAWSAETPYLYTLYVTLSDARGRTLEVTPYRVGFRSVEIVGSDFLINGRRVLLQGVNRHEHHPRTGHVLSRDDMRSDLTLMKQLNFNAVRHSHYPPDPYWLELCDEFGLYVVDEANIESHGRGYDLRHTLGNDPRWQQPHLERVTRLFERDKNHACVVTWSLGNEGGNGVNFYDAYAWLKQRDPDRPVQYERAELDFNTDLFVPQYPEPAGLLAYARGPETRPLIMSEYAHIMGNSLGNFRDYWDVIENNPKLQGGFIWEWIDQSIDTVKNGRRIQAYGGDFPLEGPVDANLSDNNFCVKGVVTAWRQLTPMALEIKHVQQPVRAVHRGGYDVELINRLFFRTLDHLRIEWEVLADGQPVERGAFDAPAVGARGALSPLGGVGGGLTVPARTQITDGREYFLNLRYRLRQDEPPLEAGYEVGFDQIALSPPRHATAPSPRRAAAPAVQQADSTCTVRGRDFTCTFNTRQGTLTGYTVGGRTLLSWAEPAFWRAPTDNDIGAGFHRSLRAWRNAWRGGAPAKSSIVPASDGTVTLQFTRTLLGGKAEHEVTYAVFADGTIDVRNEFRPLSDSFPLLLRLGHDLTAAPTLRNVRYYGRGPGENYCDRKSGSPVGRYAQTVADQYFPYARPQESGNHTDVRWVELTDARGHGLRFEYADSLLSFSALPYALDDLDPAPEKQQFHSGELDARREVYVHIDGLQSGVQGVDSWGAWPLEPYRVPWRRHAYRYVIRPVR